eukprot:GEZU01037411.1.p1 GENE.GEZU01037411.1~~GEZU01037411.1.p1  ORF type:complete len:205 (-),score=44.27 GEZU01037411.1:177-791(-)
MCCPDHDQVQDDASCTSSCLDHEGLLLAAFVHVLEDVTAKNDKLAAGTSSTKSIFDKYDTWRISIEDYVWKLSTNIHCSVQCFVLALCYMNSLADKDPSWIITSKNVHKLLLTSLVIAAKFHDDIPYSNAYCAKVGGITLCEMNKLERELLRRLDFTLRVDKELYDEYEHLLKRWIEYLQQPEDLDEWADDFESNEINNTQSPA